MAKGKIKWPFFCRLCRAGIVKCFCLVCPPVSAMSSETREERKEKNEKSKGNNEGVGE